MSPAEKRKGLLFLAGFFGGTGFLFLLLSFGTEYWLLASESCGPEEDKEVKEAGENGGPGHGRRTEVGHSGRFFHEGLFWRCWSKARPDDSSVWNLWIPNQPSSKVCEPAFLFPFPVYEPIRTLSTPRHMPVQPSEPDSAIVFRTFWSIFLIMGVVTVVIGGFVIICAAPLASHRLYKVGGALQLSGGLCLLAVVVMYVLWVQVLDTLEQYAHQQRASKCPAFHLSLHHGPSVLLAPVAVFFYLLAGLLFTLAGRNVWKFGTLHSTSTLP